MNTYVKAELMRFRSLDATRGIAALVVVIYHFQHFYAYNQDPKNWVVNITAMPLYNLLKPFYLYGWMAVDLFFVISGFIFCWMYSKGIEAKNIGFKSFLLKRFTRLYPLHILTLIITFALQGIYKNRTGEFFVIPFNDFYHLIINLLFMQSWGFEKGPSFNGPSWSISVEILLYILFFLVCRYRIIRLELMLASLVVIGLTYQFTNPIIGRGITGYFIGALVYTFFSKAVIGPNAVKVAIYSLWLCSLLWIISFVNIYINVFDFIGLDYTYITNYRWIGKIIQRIFITVVFPLTVFSLAMGESLLKNKQIARWQLAAFLGEISYSSYLMHFPLQLLIVNLSAYEYFSTESIKSIYGLLIFIIILIPLSSMMYFKFELPSQRFSRRMLHIT